MKKTIETLHVTNVISAKAKTQLLNSDPIISKDPHKVFEGLCSKKNSSAEMIILLNQQIIY